jgi:hypothetical protein
MKAISIRQPWASLIVAGHKDVENRSWRTSFRGQIYVHASQTMKRADYDDAVRFIMRRFQPARVAEILPSFAYCREMSGGLIGVMEIADCVDRHPSKWFVGPFGFCIRNAEPLHFTPCYGKLGIFTPILPL